MKKIIGILILIVLIISGCKKEETFEFNNYGNLTNCVWLVDYWYLINDTDSVYTTSPDMRFFEFKEDVILLHEYHITELYTLEYYIEHKYDNKIVTRIEPPHINNIYNIIFTINKVSNDELVFFYYEEEDNIRVRYYCHKE